MKIFAQVAMLAVSIVVACSSKNALHQGGGGNVGAGAGTGGVSGTTGTASSSGGFGGIANATGGSGGMAGATGGSGGGTAGGGIAGSGGSLGGRDGGGGGSGGQGVVSYLGCTFVGGINRVVVAKRDTGRNLCFNVVLDSPRQVVPAGLTLPTTFGLEWAWAGLASACPSRTPQSARASQVTGTVSELSGGLGTPTAVKVMVDLTFTTSDAGVLTTEQLSAETVDVSPACP